MTTMQAETYSVRHSSSSKKQNNRTSPDAALDTDTITVPRKLFEDLVHVCHWHKRDLEDWVSYAKEQMPN
jgi:hypothetical protein